MRKHHLALGLGLAAAVCAMPTRAAATPQTAPEAAVARSAAPLASTASPKQGSVTRTTAAQATAALGLVVANPLLGLARESAARARPQAKKRELPPCFAAPVTIARSRGDELEPEALSLTYCDGRPNPEALDALSILARPRDVERPAKEALRAYLRLPVETQPLEPRRVKVSAKLRDPAYVSERVMRLHPGLLERLQKVAARYPGRTLEIVSGYRPDARESSRHHHGRALDFRVQGVARERLRDFLRTFDETGVGYYPNSSFVHMDVRDDRGYWVDRSGPGERADYGAWPPPKREIEHAQNTLLANALSELRALGRPNLDAPARPAESRQAARPVRRNQDELQDEGDRMSADEVKRIRAETLRALEALR